MSQYRNAFIRSHLDYADVFYGQTYPQKNRIITTQWCITFKPWQLEKPQEKSWDSLQQNIVIENSHDFINFAAKRPWLLKSINNYLL